MSDDSDLDSDARRDYELRMSAWYQALFQAWFATRLETQRAILGLASLALGLCVTLVLGGQVSDLRARWLLFAAVVGFAVSVLTSIRVFWVNAEVIRTNLQAGEPDSSEARKAEGEAGAAHRGSLIAMAVGVLLLTLSLAVQLARLS